MNKDGEMDYIGNNSKGPKMVVVVSASEKKLADDKLINYAVSDLSPPQEFFSGDEDIDIKIEVMPSLEDMGIDIPLLIPPSDSTLENVPPPKLKRQDKPQSVPKPKPYSCPICSSVGVERAFTKPSLLKAHILYHKKTGRAILTGAKRDPDPTATPQIYTCATCNNRTFQTRKAFLHHRNFHKFLIKKYGVDRPVVPKGCRKSSIPIQDKYTCPTCQREFEVRKIYLQHLRFHSKRENGKKLTSRAKMPFAEEYKCPKCDKVYKGSSRDAYRYHLKRHRQLEEDEEKRKQRILRLRPDIPVQDSYHCVMCDRNWSESERVSYVNHVRLHENMERRGVNRPIAEKKERDGNAAEEDDTDQDYYCQTCDKHFLHKIKFRAHMKYHKQLQEQGKDRPIGTWERPLSWKDSIPSGLDTYTCETCPNRSFTSRSSFITHAMVHRSLKKKGRDRPLLTKEEWAQKCQKESTCTFCNLTFASVRELKEHDKEIHPKEGSSTREGVTSISWSDLVPEQPTYTCDMCPEREFDGRHSYITHLKIHRSLARKGEDRPIMSRGEWAIHRKIKPKLVYNCATCNKGFGKKPMYNNHMRYHAILRRKEGEDRVIGGKRLKWKDSIPYLDHYTCDKCPDRTFEDRKAYIGHLAYHKLLDRKGKGKDGIRPPRKKTEEEEDMKCSLCDRVFTEIKAYRFHKAYHAQIRKKTGQDRAIVKKEEPSSGRKSLSVNEVLAEMMENLNKFGCGCGEVFYFKDAFLHHLTLAASKNCGEMVKVKTEVVEEEGPQEKEENDDQLENQPQLGPSSLCDNLYIDQEPVGLTISQVVGARDNAIGDGDLEEKNVNMESYPIENEESEIIVNEEADFGSPHEEPFADKAEEEPYSGIKEEEKPYADKEEVGVQVVSPSANPIQQREEWDQSDENEEQDPLLALFHCDVCNSDSSSLTQYLSHQYQRHLVDQTSPLPCPFCALQFKLGSGLFVHCKKEHDEIFPVEEFYLPCSFCGIVIHIAEGQEMEHHFKQEHPKTVCRLCNTMWSDSALLNKHIVETHLKRRK